MPLRVICIGAGVAGLSAAIACRENASSITLLEAAESMDEMNIRAAGIAIVSCGAHVMRNVLGLEPVADVDAVRGSAVRALNWTDGSVLRETNLPHHDWYTAHRGSLLDALLRKATSSEEKGVAAELLLGKKVKDVDVDAGIVTTEDGGVYEADVIIGGDGVRSVTRKAIVEEAIVQPSGFSVYRWTMTQADWQHLANKSEIDALIGPDARNIIVCDSEETRLVTYRCHASGVVNGLLVLPDRSLPRTSEDWHAAGNVNHLRYMVRDICEPLRSIVGCVGSCGLWQLRKQVPLRTWNKGKAIILGDAAHPMLPFQSAAGALAMEDAEALQYCLAQVNWEPERVPEALSKTFCLRFLRCSIVQHFSNAGPFRTEVVDEAAKWSMRYLAGQQGNAVPVMSAGADDVVQSSIASKLAELVHGVDPAAPVHWVIDYKLSDFLEKKREYILEAPYV